MRNITLSALGVALSIIVIALALSGCQSTTQTATLTCNEGAYCYVDGSGAKQDRGGNSGTPAISVGAAGGVSGAIEQPSVPVVGQQGE